MPHCHKQIEVSHTWEALCGIWRSLSIADSMKLWPSVTVTVKHKLFGLGRQVCCKSTSREKLTGRLCGCAFIGCVWGEYTSGAEPAFCPGLYGDCQERKMERWKQQQRIYYYIHTRNIISHFHRQQYTRHTLTGNLLWMLMGENVFDWGLCAVQR